ncbi:unnamed protein product, partial [marine sediment metagenome]
HIFRKYWWAILIGSVLIGLAILVQTTKDTNDFAKWIFNFIDDWAFVLSAIIMFFLATAAFLSILENRLERVEHAHRLALLRIRGWAEMTVNILGTPTKQILFQKKKIEEITKLHDSHVKTTGILHDAERLGGTLNDSVKTAVAFLLFYSARLSNQEQIEVLKRQLKLKDNIVPIKSDDEMRESIIELLTSFTGVIKTATEILVPKIK